MIRYAKSIVIQNMIQRNNPNKIYPPTLTIEYVERKPSAWADRASSETAEAMRPRGAVTPRTGTPAESGAEEKPLSERLKRGEPETKDTESVNDVRTLWFDYDPRGNRYTSWTDVCEDSTFQEYAHP